MWAIAIPQYCPSRVPSISARQKDDVPTCEREGVLDADKP